MSEEDYEPSIRPVPIEAEARADAGDPDYVWRNRRATPRKIDFSTVPSLGMSPSGYRQDWDVQNDRYGRKVDADGKLLTAKQVRARARRKAKARQKYEKLSARQKKKVEAPRDELNAQELEVIAQKPIDDWDNEELARGRPRDIRGGFSGRPPSWVSREVHEEAMNRFQSVIKTEMNFQGIQAIEALNYILGNNDVDNRGKPLIPPSTKADAAKFFLEHIVGKPKQRIESDISVKLQGILGAVMVNPGDDDGGFNMAHMPGYTLPLGDPNVVDGEIVDDDSDLDEDDG